jgi:hypothetical protein
LNSTKIVDEIRKEIECCCSWTRYEAIILLLNQLEEELREEKVVEWIRKKEYKKSKKVNKALKIIFILSSILFLVSAFGVLWINL